MSANATIKMYPGTTFGFYIPDDLVRAAKKDVDDNVTVDKSGLPLYQIEVLNHEKWSALQDVLEAIEVCHDKAEAGDRSQIKAASAMQLELVKKHVKSCRDFPVDGFEPNKYHQLLSARQIAHLTKAINAQMSNEDIDMTVKKKLDSPSVSPTNDAEAESVEEAESAKTSQPT